MAIEDLLEEIAGRDWYIYSLYNHPHDRPGPFQWETTLRHEAGPNSLAAHGQGASMFEALAQAVNNIDRAAPHIMPTFLPVQESSTSISDILSRIAPKREPIERKI